MTGWGGVLALFLIPVGGGIPGGVLLAKSRGIGWPAMEFLYLISDIILAFIFEPLMKLAISAGRNVPRMRLAADGFKRYLDRTMSSYGSAGGPLTLILIAFGVDPMTGRAAAAAAGHGFISGWTFAITGDMMYFTVLMVGTLWLNWLLGDAKTTTILILVLMFALPPVIRRLRGVSK